MTPQEIATNSRCYSCLPAGMAPAAWNFLLADNALCHFARRGEAWTTHETPDLDPDFDWLGVDWSPKLGLFVAVGSTNAPGTRTGGAMVSRDGASWELISSFPNVEWCDVIWIEQLEIFIAVSKTADNKYSAISEDGFNWNFYPINDLGALSNIAYSPSLNRIVVVATSGANQVAYSSDGVNWTQASAASSNQWAAVAWSPELNLFAAVSQNGSGNRVMTSPDGITWTSRTSAANNVWNGIIWVPELAGTGLFVAVSRTNGSQNVMTSPDGTNWTIRTTPNGTTLYSIAWSPEFERLVAVGTGAGSRVVYSDDAINWTPVDANLNSWRNVTYAPSLCRFVAVGSNGGAVQQQAMTS